jgi:hypothetical protein
MLGGSGFSSGQGWKDSGDIVVLLIACLIRMVVKLFVVADSADV